MNESIVLTMGNLEWVHAVFPQLSAIIKLAGAGFVQKLGPRYFYQNCIQEPGFTSFLQQ